MIDELVTWGLRLFQLLPEIMGLWNAAKASNAKAKLDAQLALVRKMEDMQALEEIRGA
mgnify:CR=1 FL=1